MSNVAVSCLAGEHTGFLLPFCTDPSLADAADTGALWDTPTTSDALEFLAEICYAFSDDSPTNENEVNDPLCTSPPPFPSPASPPFPSPPPFPPPSALPPPAWSGEQVPFSPVTPASPPGEHALHPAPHASSASTITAATDYPVRQLDFGSPAPAPRTDHPPPARPQRRLRVFDYIREKVPGRHYECTLCNQTFKSRRANAAAHVREVHLQVRSIACLQCDYKSNRTSNVRRHCRSKHGVFFPAVATPTRR